jgi:hypothetical protein
MLELWSLSQHLISKALKWKGENCHQGIEQITTKIYMVIICVLKLTQCDLLNHITI